MTLNYSAMERTVGLFILLAFLSVMGTVIAVGKGQNWFRKHNEYFAVYKEGYNLQPGVKVKLLRTDIGQVTHVELTDDNQVRVTMRILTAYASRIRTDSKAAIESPTFIGSEYINIIPGTAETPMIEPGNQIPSKEQKKISDYLEEVDFEHKLLLVEQILESTANIAYQLEHPNGPLLGTLNNVRKLSGDMAAGKGTIGRIVQEDEMYLKLLDDLDRLETILASINTAVDELKTTAKSTTSVARDIDEITKKVKGDVPAIVSKIQTILNDIENVSRKLETAMDQAPEISSDARDGIRQVNEILESVKKNFIIRPNLPPAPEPESHGVMMRGE